MNVREVSSVSERFDVLIVGAGLSGVAAAYHLQTQCPTKRFAIFEARDATGGTWDIFRYPGVRSDSDMHTLGYAFRPWTDTLAIAGGASILRYIRETAAAHGIDRAIRVGHRVERASWSSAEGEWIVEVAVGPERRTVRYACTFLFVCSGYFDSEEGYQPEWPQRDQFRGAVVHPQRWPEELDYAGKRIVVIGSGATAVTLVPALVKRAAHVTMLQRSPTYVVARGARDAIAEQLSRVLPAKTAHSLVRWKNVLLSVGLYALARRKPAFVKRLLVRLAHRRLGAGYDVARHFTPRYNPWDQRLCVAPDGDLFDAIRSGAVSVITDEIERFTESGIRLRSGADLDADVIVTATGLKLKPIGGIAIVVDGEPLEFAKTLAYKAMMFSDIPNFATVFGYVNASWTLKAELVARYVCRLLNYMDARGFRYCVPRRTDPSLAEMAGIGINAGYVLRALHLLPKQGMRKPWRLDGIYPLDMLALRFGSLTDDVMEFKHAERRHDDA